MNRHRCGYKPHLPGWIECGAVCNRTYPDNKFTPIYRGDRNRGAKASIYFENSP